MMVMAAVWGLTHVCCRWYEGGALGNLLFRFAICMVVPNVLLLLCYCRTAECKDFLRLLKRMGSKVLGRIKG